MKRLVAALALVALGLVAWVASRYGSAIENAFTPGPTGPLADSRTRVELVPPPVQESAALAEVEPARTPVRADATGPHGRVVDGATGAGVAGFRVRMLRDAKELAVATSDANGAFQFLPFGEAGIYVDVDPRRGWAIIDRLFFVSEAQAQGEEPMILRVRRLAEAPIRGTLVDELTREPVPDMTLELRGGAGPNETVVTDGEGRFATRETFDAGRVRVELRDGEQSFGTAWLDFSGGQAPVELAIAIGPTYRFRVLGRAPESGELGALLVDDGSVRHVDERDWHRLAQVLPSGDALRARFRPVDADLGDRPPWQLLVARRDGAAYGLAQIDAKIGRHERELAVELVPSASLVGTVRRMNGDPIAEASLHFALAATGDNDRWRTYSSKDGSFALHFLPPGAYAMAVLEERSEPYHRELLVMAGSAQRLDVALTSTPIAGRIAGVLLGTRPLHRSTSMRLITTGLPYRFFHVDPEAVDGPGNIIGRFAIEDVPPGEYRLEVDSSFGEWDPAELVVRPPAEGLELRRHDDVPLVDYVVRASETATGEPVGDLDFDMLYERHRTGASTDRSEAIVAEHPADLRFQWRLSSDGYAAVYGDQDAFDTREDGGERPRLVADVPLERGWALLLVVRCDGGPVAGAEIRLDGVLAEATDADGRALVRAAHAPERLEVLHPSHAPHSETLSVALERDSRKHLGCPVWLSKPR